MLAFSVLWANAKKLRRPAWYARKRWYPLLAVAEELEDTMRRKREKESDSLLRSGSDELREISESPRTRSTSVRMKSAGDVHQETDISHSRYSDVAPAANGTSQGWILTAIVTARAIFPLAALSSLDFILVSLANRSDSRPLYERISRCAKISPASLSMRSVRETDSVEYAKVEFLIFVFCFCCSFFSNAKCRHWTSDPLEFCQRDENTTGFIQCEPWDRQVNNMLCYENVWRTRTPWAAWQSFGIIGKFNQISNFVK